MRTEHAAANPMNQEKARQLNAEALAYLGDAIYEKRIREMLLEGRAFITNFSHSLSRFLS